MRLFKSLALAALILSAPIAVSGCATVLPIFTQPTDAKTLANVLQLATAATKAVDIAVNTHTLDSGTLVQLKVLNDNVHREVVRLEQDQANHVPLIFSAFNAAMDAFTAYANTKGIAVSTS